MCIETTAADVEGLTSDSNNVMLMVHIIWKHVH